MYALNNAWELNGLFEDGNRVPRSILCKHEIASDDSLREQCRKAIKFSRLPTTVCNFAAIVSVILSAVVLLAHFFHLIDDWIVPASLLLLLVAAGSVILTVGNWSNKKVFQLTKGMPEIISDWKKLAEYTDLGLGSFGGSCDEYVLGCFRYKLIKDQFGERITLTQIDHSFCQVFHMPATSSFIDDERRLKDELQFRIDFMTGLGFSIDEKEIKAMVFTNTRDLTLSFLRKEARFLGHKVVHVSAVQP